MKWIPKVVYNAVTFEFTQPQKLWRPKNKGIGGTDRSASGVVESFKVNREYIIRLVLRFRESELADVDAWLTWAQDNQGTPFDFYFDKDDGTTLYTVLLEKPSFEDGEIEPDRADRHGIYEIAVELRNSEDERFNVQAYA
jgi:hypothetical protein